MLNTLNKNAPASFTREVELVLYCSQVRLKDKVKAKINGLIANKLDWKYIYRFCDRHRIIPLLCKSLKAIDNPQIPQDILNKFSYFYNKNTFHNILISSSLVELAELFTAEGIDVISFKGSTLAVSAYGNIALRTFCDLDILIEPRNVVAAIDILNGLGYSSPKQITEIETLSYISSSVFHESQHNQKSLVFTKEKERLVLELHWSLSEQSFPFNVTFEQLWNNRTYVNLSGSNIPQFSAEDLLIYLCVHGSSHCWFKLKWICDVNELICANPQIDWQTVQNRANKWGCRRMLHLGLILAQNLLDTDLPENIKQITEKNTAAQSLARQVNRLLFDTSENKFNSYLFLLQCRERNRDKLTYLFKTILTPNEKDWYFRKLPKHLHFLYYIIRPYRLAYEYFFKH